ncbi:MAG: molybdopterin-dependent oxidoreductase [Anaerolineae bacterium]|nr:molybdopterin-dependent oxidoreductase [Anaerolineae bacterium]
MSPADAPHVHDPLQPHAHDPNPEPPSPDPSFVFIKPNEEDARITVADLQRLPLTSIPNCYIVSTGHGTSGPFTFGGVTLLDFIQSQIPPTAQWSQVEVISADGFGNRVSIEELLEPDPAGPTLLSYVMDGQAMTRQQGLIRMIVPSEKDDALRQVKWVGKIVVK